MKDLSRRNFLGNVGVIGAGAIIAPSVMASTPGPKQSGDSFKPLGRKIKVGIIGCGSVMNGNYAPHLGKCPFAEIVSVCDIKPDRAEKAAKKFNVPNWYPHIDKMMAGAEFDLLVNCTDMQEHGRLNRIAIMADKYVWSEKPMATTYNEAKELFELAKSRGKHIWGAPAVVNSPQFAFMAKQLNEAKLGRVAAAHAHYGHMGPEWSAFFYEPNGGSMPDLGVYNMVTLTGLLGPVKSVVAMTNIITKTRNVEDKGLIQVREEDNAQILLEHQNGVLSHIQCGFNYFDPHGHSGKGQDRPTISITGSGGSMHMIGYDWYPLGVEMATIANPELQMFSTDRGTYVWQEGASVICEHLSTGKELLITSEHSLHVVEIIESARKSQATGKRIPLRSTFKWPVVV
jgi:predicted dehydrogenase